MSELEDEILALGAIYSREGEFAVISRSPSVVLKVRLAIGKREEVEKGKGRGVF